MKDSLEKLAGQFSTHPVAAAREMRQFCEQDPPRFVEEAISLLRLDHSPPGLRYALTLVENSGLIFQRLCNPDALSRDEAVRIGRYFAETSDSSFVVKLTDQVTPDNRSALRVLEILEAIPAVPRVMRYLNQAAKDGDERIRSKAALLIGRVNRNLGWALERLSEHDPRVRANAVEALWGLDSDEACAVFHTALSDRDNRVAGNAALALYFAGDIRAAEHLSAMLESPDLKQRATAVWAMGETEDARFLPDLSRYVAERGSPARAKASRSITRINDRVKRIGEGSRLKVAIAASLTENSRCRLEIAVSDPGLRPISGMRPLDFIVTHGDRVIHRVSLRERTDIEQTCTGFVIPQGTEERSPGWILDAIEQFVQWETRSLAWMVGSYSTPARKAEMNFKSSLLARGSGRVLSDAPFLEASRSWDSYPVIFEGAKFRKACRSAIEGHSSSAESFEVIRGMISSISGFRGTRHLVVVADEQLAWRMQRDSSLQASATSARITLHSLSISPDSPEELICECNRMSARLFHTYTIAYEAPSTGRAKVAVQILSRKRFGEGHDSVKSVGAERNPAMISAARNGTSTQALRQSELIR